MSSELGSAALRPLALPMLHQLLNRLQGYFFLESKRLDYLSSLSEHITLNQPFVRVLSVPLFADGHAHKGVKLLRAVVLVRQVLDPVLLSELLVSLLGLVDLNATQLRVLPLFF